MRFIDVVNFMTWKCPCMDCETPNRSGVGIFCSNFLRIEKYFPPWYAVWCGECHLPHLEYHFQVQISLAVGYKKSRDLETEKLLNNRLRIARDGDNLMGIPFLCDLCHFRNVNYRDPIHGNARDNYTLLCIRRKILDAFWSRETSTVSGNFRRLRRDYFDSVEALIIRIPVPITGTDGVRDVVGMVCALQTLDASRSKGKW